MKKALFSLALCLMSTMLWAVPASPYPFQVTQPDGSTLMVRLIGDEYHAYYTTVDGTPLRLMDNGFFVEDHTVKEQSNQIAMQRRNVAANNKASASTYPLTGQPKSLVILVSFKDKAFTSQLDDFNNLLNQSGYDYNGATGSCRDYFISASDSIFQPQFDVYGPYTLSENMAYYGDQDGDAHDKRPGDMIIEACQLAAEAGVDFDQYDINNDNILDNVFVYYAGHNQAEGGGASTVWPHKSNLTYRNKTVNGKRLATYACTSEYSGSNGTRRASIGTFCHEFGHVLGLPDLYDTNNQYYTVANWSIMATGSYNNAGNTPPTYSAYERFFTGWLKPEQLTIAGQYNLSPLQSENTAYLIAEGEHNLIGSMPSPKEFFLLEYRTKTGWDTYLPGKGMLVWHIDYNAAAWVENRPNNGPDFLRIHLEEANGIPWNKRTRGESGQASDPYPGTKNITNFVPKLHDGTVLSDQNLFNIAEEDGWISFIYKGIGDVELSSDVQALSLTTTVSDNRKIVDWNPQSFTLTAKELLSDTIMLTSAGNFSLAVGEECPSNRNSGWSRSVRLIADSMQTTNTYKVWVSFIPNKQSCDDVTGSVSVSTLGASLSIYLVGYSPRPTYITSPEVLAPTNITPYSFTLAWQPVEDAVQYYVTLYQVAEGAATFTQKFEDFASAEAIKSQGWEANFARTTTSAKFDGTRSLFFKNTGEYVVSEEYMAPLQSMSFWVHAFYTDSLVAGYLDIEMWDGTDWVLIPDLRVEILPTTKNTTAKIDFDEVKYTRARFTYTDIGGAGVAFDAFKATCDKQVTYLYRGDDLIIDAFTYDSSASKYEITGLSANTTYYCSMQSSDITKGCEEHISALSEPIEIKTVAVQETDDDDNRLSMVIDYTNHGQPTPVVYLENPNLGSTLNVYNVKGDLVCSIPVLQGVTEYVIPTTYLQKNCLYLIKYIDSDKMKRKQGWAKFVL